jgi:hypothetical protein
MVENGRTRAEAAQLRRPDVLAFRNERMEVLRTSAAARTIRRASQLMDSAESERVRLDATKWVAGLDGIAAVSRSEAMIDHKGLGPGLQVVILPSPAQHEPGSSPPARIVPFVSREKHHRSPVPHPAIVQGQKSDVQ